MSAKHYGNCERDLHASDCPCQLNLYADAIMVMIDEDMAGGYVPGDVDSFSALHDHVDANMYYLQAMGVEFATDPASNGLVNAVLDEVDRRLRARGGEVSGQERIRT